MGFHQHMPVGAMTFGRLLAMIAAAGAVATTSARAFAQDERPTVQRRYAEKDDSLYLHATGTTHIRNDFYNSFGAGADVGYYPSETLGFEVRALFLDTKLSNAAVDVKERTGLTPDARPQGMLFTAGPRWSFGYGKILAINRFVLHFDPQLTFQGGIARADRRILPTAYTALTLLTHYKWGIQAKIDLGTTIQMEKRDRGWVTTFGFLPVLGIGWNFGIPAAEDES